MKIFVFSQMQVDISKLTIQNEKLLSSLFPAYLFLRAVEEVHVSHKVYKEGTNHTM